jgi:hypothetical protein
VHTSAPQPTLSRVLSLIWFPFFFAAAFTLMGLFAFANPTPHNLNVAVVGTAEQGTAVQTVLDELYPGGFVTQTVGSPQTAFAEVTNDDVVAAFAPGATTSPLLVASAGGASQAKFLQTAFAAVGTELGAGPVSVTDAVPTSAGDVSGVGLFFFAFPQLLVGLITSIVLLQFGMWSLRKKVLLIAATGLFASVFAFVIAVALDVIPADPWLILFGFILTQAIGWLTTAAAIFGKRYFLPIAMTFVLVLGVPSAGGTVSGDMLPGFIRALHSFLPFAQYLEAARASAYFNGAGIVTPLVILVAWAALGGGLLLIAAGLAARARRASAAALASELRDPEVRDLQLREPDSPDPEQRASELVDVAAAEPALGDFFGTVKTTAGRTIAGASVLLLNESGAHRRTATSTENGTYSISDVPAGLHYAVVTAPHCEPEIATIALHAGHHGHGRDFTLLDWDDASGNLTAEEIDSRNALSAH